MLKINDLIAALQEQAKKHGNVDLSIEIELPERQIPKNGASKYYHMFGPWCMTGDTEDGKNHLSFRFHEDSEGNWVDLTFIGRISGEFSELSGKELRQEAQRI